MRIVRCEDQVLYLEQFLQDHSDQLSSAFAGKTAIIYDINGFYSKFIGINPSDYFRHIPDDCLQALRVGKALLFLDYSGEGTSFIEEFATSIHIWCGINYVDPENIVLCQQNYSWPKDYILWCNKEHISQRIRMIFAHSFMHNLLLAAEHYGIYDKFLANLNESGPRPKRFLSFNHQPSPHRVMIVRYLLEMCPEKAWFSIGLRKANMDEEAAFGLVKAIYLGPKLLQEFPFYQQTVPLAEMASRATLPRPVKEMTNVFDAPLYRDVYFNIVCESECYGIEFDRFTEKSIKPFLFGVIPLFVASPHITDALKDIGFSTFPEVLPELYDQAISAQDRILLLLREIDRLRLLSDNECEEIFVRSLSKRLANFEWAHRKLLPTYVSWLVSHIATVVCTPIESTVDRIKLV